MFSGRGIILHGSLNPSEWKSCDMIVTPRGFCSVWFGWSIGLVSGRRVSWARTFEKPHWSHLVFIFYLASETNCIFSTLYSNTHQSRFVFKFMEGLCLTSRFRSSAQGWSRVFARIYNSGVKLGERYGFRLVFKVEHFLQFLLRKSSSVVPEQGEEGSHFYPSFPFRVESSPTYTWNETVNFLPDSL